MSIDLSRLPPPQVVETLSIEQIFESMRSHLLELSPELADALNVESEPLTKLLQVCAYREYHVRQRVNEATRAVMLAFASGSDLDQIGANYGVARLIVEPGDPAAFPPVPPTYESDDDYRTRIQLSLDGYTTAGSRSSYVFHGLSADGRVKDVSAVSPAPGMVTVYVLSREGDGTASEELLENVSAALSAERVRPMTDQVTVQSAAIVTYTIEAELELDHGPDPEVVRAAAVTAAQQYANEIHRIRSDVALSGIYHALHQPGVRRVRLLAPTSDIAISEGQAPYCTAITVTIAEVRGV